MGWFVTLSGLMLLTTSGLLILVLSRRPWMLVKPSVSVVVFFHIMVQWSAALNARDLFDFLPNPWPFFLLAQGFPLLVVCGSMCTFNRAYRRVWVALTSASVMTAPSKAATRILSLLVVLISALYLWHVPLRTTGLYMIFTDPLNSQIGREDSLKLVESPLVRYLFSFMASAFCTITRSPTLDQGPAQCRPWAMAVCHKRRRIYCSSSCNRKPDQRTKLCRWCVADSVVQRVSQKSQALQADLCDR